MQNTFDNVATAYDLCLSELPNEYIDLIKNSFNINGNDKIIDLGCGSGHLTKKLSIISNSIEGLDNSQEMIKIAKNKDKTNTIKWIYNSVQNFDYGINNYKLIISYESFHLFGDPKLLIDKFYNSLIHSGYVCMGWCEYYWEQPLKNIIINVFKDNGIDWGPWGFQYYEDFYNDFNQSNLKFSKVIDKSIQVFDSFNIYKIASYLTSISLSCNLDYLKRNQIYNDLVKEFLKLFGSETINGLSTYSIAYSKKLSNT